MGKSKKSLFLGVRPIGGPAVKSRRVARKVTTQYHTLIQQRNAIEANKAQSKEDKAAELKRIDEEIGAIGGINRYQEASVISTKHFSTSKWIVQTLRRLRPEWAHSGERRQAFEVGAINTQLHSAPFLSVRSIDLHSQHALIEEKDFFTVPPLQTYDVVVCSMVINYVGDPFRRAEMVARLCRHLRGPDSVLFLILPRRCLSSPFFSGADDFLLLLQRVFGLELLEEPHHTPKVAFFTLRYSGPFEAGDWLQSMKMGIEGQLKQNASELAQAPARWRRLLIPEAARPPAALTQLDPDKTSADDFSICLGNQLLTVTARQCIRSICV